VNVLWHIELSHYNEKVRWALDYKGVPYERRVPMPGLHGVRALIETRGAQRRLPVVRLEGRAIGDSTAIIAALEEHTPEPPLYPSDPAERERALALEEFFDEELAPDVRRFGWHHILRHPDDITGALFTRSEPVRERLVRAAVPVARVAVRRDYAIDPDSDEKPRQAILAAMDRLESELRPSGYLAGDAFSVADLTAAALFTPLVQPPERPFLPARVPPAIGDFGRELTERPGGQWILETYARHRGAYAGAPA
jgi:glutathione S-transferase